MKDNGQQYSPLAVNSGNGDAPLNCADGGELRIPSLVFPLSCVLTAQKDRPSNLPAPWLRHLLVAALTLSLLPSATCLVFLVLNAWTQRQLHPLLSGIVVQGTSDYKQPAPGLLKWSSVYTGLDELSPEVQHSALLSSLDVFLPLFQPIDCIHWRYVFSTD